MPPDFDDHDPALTVEAHLRVNEVCERFEASWKEGGRPRIEDYLGNAEGKERRKMLFELLALEIEYRPQRAETPCRDDHDLRFPFDPDAVASAFGGAAAPPFPPAIGKYRVIGLLGDGGQASVYRTAHPELETELVIKLAHEPLRDGREALLAEGRVLAELEHPNLTRVYDLDLDGDRPFLVMEYVRGRSLHEEHRRSRASSHQAARLVAKVARALDVAHRRGVVHLDIKPQNIVMDEGGEPRLIDFGLARRSRVWPTRGGRIEGCTAAYASPEQARRESELGPESDIFSLGAVLYWLLCGEAPFAAEDLNESFERARRCDLDREALRRAGAPRALERICLTAMEKEPERRFAATGEMADELERFAGGPLRVTSFRVEHWHNVAGDTRYVGIIGESSFETFFDDDVRLSIELSDPGYIYLVAFNPDGTEQLCRPEDPNQSPGKGIDFQYPRADNVGFGLTDGVGLQAFGLLASREPLAPYAQWRSRVPEVRWSSVQSDAIWRFDGKTERVLQAPATRGEERPLRGSSPLAGLYELLKSSEFEVVQAIAFPVVEKDAGSESRDV